MLVRAVLASHTDAKYQSHETSSPQYETQRFLSDWTISPAGPPTRLLLLPPPLDDRTETNRLTDCREADRPIDTVNGPTSRLLLPAIPINYSQPGPGGNLQARCNYPFLRNWVRHLFKLLYKMF